MSNSHQPTFSKKTDKRVVLVLLMTCGVFPVVLLVSGVCQTMGTLKRGRCNTNVAHLRTAVVEYFLVKEYYEGKGHLPNFIDEEGNALWSWRVCFTLTNERNSKSNEQNSKLDTNRAWNTPENLLAINTFPRIDYYESFFTCPSFYPKDTRSSYVIVTGPGTFWTELSNGRIDNPYEYADMIFMIETTEPKNFWAEPGDEISPEEVIRLYQSNPGLLKGSLTQIYSWNHYPKHFATWGASGYTFADIKDVEELKRRLVIPEHELPERPTEPE